MTTTTSSEIEPLLFNVSQAAAALNVSNAQIYAWVAAGLLARLPPEISRHLLIPRVDIEAFVARARKAS